MPGIRQTSTPNSKGKTVAFRLTRLCLLFFLECVDALGMESGAIPDGKIRASTEWDSNHAAKQARLNFPGGHGKAGSWSSRRNDGNQWLQIDLSIQNIKVTGLASQGRANADQWVTKYKLQYSHDGVNFDYYKEPGQGVPKVRPPINSMI